MNEQGSHRSRRNKADRAFFSPFGASAFSSIALYLNGPYDDFIRSRKKCYVGVSDPPAAPSARYIL